VVTESKPKYVDNLNNVRCEASRHFRNKKKEYLKAKINELETNRKNKNIRDLYHCQTSRERQASQLLHLVGGQRNT
jgi:hypothetical protein